MKKVMVLEDESSIRSFIVINLRRAGYEVIEAETGEEALEKLQQNHDIRVALLDIMLPGIDGFEVCRRIRATNAQIGIIMLTARSQEMDKVTGLMTGADDYMTKPFSPSELVARVKAHLNRYERLVSSNVKENSIIEIRGIKIDKEQCDILCDEIHRVKEGGKMADVKPEVKALCEELSGFKYEDCFAHNNVGFQDGSVIPAE